MAASFKVNQPAEFTIQIGVKFHNGTLTMQPHLVPQHSQLQLPGQMLRPLTQAPSPDKNLDNLVRGMNSLSMNNDLVEDSSAPPRIQSPIESQEPPAMLNQTKRRERANLRPRPIGIPNVSDTDDCARAQRRAMRSAAAAQRGTSDHEGIVFIHKAPNGGRPLKPGGAIGKLMRGPDDQVEACRAEVDDKLENCGYESEEVDPCSRRRQPSSLAPDYSPFASGDSSHGSSSPPTSYQSAPTPSTVDGSVASGPVAGPALIRIEDPPRRRRGRPPKKLPEGAPVQPAAPRNGQLQPRPTAVGIADFVSPFEILDASKAMKNYTEADLTFRNERGELLSHILAKEGNWAKVVALNIRWLSNASLDDLFTGINTETSMGHTAIIEAVVQQNVKAVEYCCLFTCNSDVHLFRALVEAALLKSDAIFNTILHAMCHEMDENGNQVKRTSRFIDSPISGWSFCNQDLSSYAGLTLAQALTVQPPQFQFHQRLKALISYGADPSRFIGQDAVEKYREYINCVYLAAAFSPKPLDCLVALGIKPEANQPIEWDRSGGETLEWCVSTICSRSELDTEYREFVRTSLSRPKPGMPVLDVDDVYDILLGLDC